MVQRTLVSEQYSKHINRPQFIMECFLVNFSTFWASFARLQGLCILTGGRRVAKVAIIKTDQSVHICPH